jgi:hypothetical protein
VNAVGSVGDLREGARGLDPITQTNSSCSTASSEIRLRVDPSTSLPKRAWRRSGRTSGIWSGSAMTFEPAIGRLERGEPASPLDIEDVKRRGRERLAREGIV